MCNEPEAIQKIDWHYQVVDARALCCGEVAVVAAVPVEGYVDEQADKPEEDVGEHDRCERGVEAASRRGEGARSTGGGDLYQCLVSLETTTHASAACKPIQCKTS